ncbi:hypothetical protein N7535_000949 [Penicillium sp. DV-2018c]|nr:hypothetical protein N7535_000949 [Penicillium sp. DV-2018c]
MDNEVPLPPPRRLRHRSSSKSTNPTNTAIPSFHRAGQLSRFDDCSSQPSSDPALFSSDDIPASGLENYHAPVSGAGRKRRYRGTWWGEQVVDPKRKRAEFKEKRNFDSGVWMGSDEPGSESLMSEDGSSWGDDLRKTVLDAQSQQRVGPAPVDSGSGSVVNLFTPGSYESRKESTALMLARAVIGHCVEKGEDCIDLGEYQFGSIPPGLLQPLKHLTKLPAFTAAPATEKAFTSLQPFLRIFLHSNCLSTLPHDLFELKHLKVLSLRSNEFTEIPPQICKLMELEHLNISVNRLSYLPWELLKLTQQGRLNFLYLRPNPFLPFEEAHIKTWHCKPETEDISETEEQEQEQEPNTIPRLKQPLQVQPPASHQLAANTHPCAPIHVATGPTHIMDLDGKPTESNSSNNDNNAAPSLRELALRAVTKLPYLDQTTDEELAEFPPLLVPLLKRAREVRLAGGQTCSVCGKEYVLARTEWLEWWDVSPHVSGLLTPRRDGDLLRPLPFRRFGCSLACVPSA